MQTSQEIEAQQAEVSKDKHLRSVAEVRHYVINNGSEDIGDVHDFIVEEGTWMIRYLVVDTGRWLPGRKVLIAPTWIEDVSWQEKKVAIWLTREEVKASPPYDPASPVNREYETLLYDFYGRPTYWKEAAAAHTASR